VARIERYRIDPFERPVGCKTDRQVLRWIMLGLKYQIHLDNRTMLEFRNGKNTTPFNRH
jgi:hypothetical protein